MISDSQCRSADSTPRRSDNRHPRSIDVSPRMLAILFLVGVLQHLAIGLLLGVGLMVNRSHTHLGSISYYVLWSSVGGLVGFAISRKGVRASMIGLFAGLILAEILRL